MSSIVASLVIYCILLIALLKHHLNHSHYRQNSKLKLYHGFSFCLFQGQMGQQHGSNQHYSHAVKLKTCL